NRTTDIVVPNTISDYPVTKIAPRAFSNNTKLTSISFTDAMSLKSIGKYAFYACSSIEEIIIPGWLNSIGEFAFQDCTSLKNVSIYSNVSVIPEQAFGNCISLEKINIPSTVKSIGSYAFYNCSALTELTLSKNIADIANGAFYNCPNLTLYGYYDTVAESYAEQNNIPFVHLDKKVISGDVNLDGKIDINDVTLLQRYIAGESVLTDDAVKVADFNKDRIIDVIDVTAIQTFIAHGQN
ncbi:leucine-rich repeat protein, partial [Ruminococcus sp.]